MKKTILGVLTILFLLPLSAVAQHGPWVITTDYGALGRVQAFAPEAPWSASGELAVIPGDAVGRYHQGLVYVVGRGGSDLIRIHDPAAGFALVREFSIGAGCNPQDIAFDGQGRAFVSCYDEAVLLMVDVEAGQVVQSFDTSPFADGDGLPETGWLRVVGQRLYVNCQKLDRANWYAPAAPGQLLVLDLDTLQWLSPIQLASSNPYTPLRLDDHGRLLVGCVGFWGVFDGGIEVVNPDTGLSEGLLLTAEELGGEVLNFVLTGTGLMHALTSDTSFATRISRVEINNSLVTPLVTSTGYDLADLAWDGDFQLYVADRKVGASGLRVFDTDSGSELTSTPVAMTLPPFQFILPARPVASPVPQNGNSWGSLSLGLPQPNPCNPAAMVEIMDHPDQTVRVAVYDLAGRRVQQATMRTDAAGRARFRFAGRLENGTTLPAGMYRVVAQSTGGFAARSLMLVK